jgi:hypothetical protein
MLIDRSHRTWAVTILLATLVSALLYIYQFHPAWLPFLPQPRTAQPRTTPGRTILGLVYGSVALVIFIFACLLGLRRRLPVLPIGRMQTWLRAHIWLSVFTIPLVLMHAGFVTGGPMTTLLMILYATVMISGFFGLALQQCLPRMMTDTFPREAIYEQIPYLRSQLLARAQVIREILVKPPLTAVAAPSARPVAEAIPSAHLPPVFPAESIEQVNNIVIPYLRATGGKRLALSNGQISDVFFRHMRIKVPPELEPTIAELQDLCDERRRLDRQTTYQHWLHGWLIVHIPFSLALLILTMWHAAVALFFD